MRLGRAHPALVVAAFSLIGAVGAGAMAFNTADRFASRATMNVRPALPATASETARQEDIMPRLARDAFSRDFLTAIIQKHDLYHSDRAQSSTEDEDLVDRVRGDIRIQLISRSVVQVSFASTDARKAQTVANDLVSQLLWANFQAGRGSLVQLIDPPDEPRGFVSPRRVAVAGLGGLSGGALLGTLIGLLRRRPSPPAS